MTQYSETLWDNIGLPKTYASHVPVTVTLNGHCQYSLCDNPPVLTGTHTGTPDDLLETILEKDNRCEHCLRKTITDLTVAAGRYYRNNMLDWMYRKTLLINEIATQTNPTAIQNASNISNLRNTQTNLASLTHPNEQLADIAYTLLCETETVLNQQYKDRDNLRSTWKQTIEDGYRPDHNQTMLLDDTPILVVLNNANTWDITTITEIINVYEIDYKNNHVLLNIPYWVWLHLHLHLGNMESQSTHLNGLEQEKLGMILPLYAPQDASMFQTLHGTIQAIQAL